MARRVLGWALVAGLLALSVVASQAPGPLARLLGTVGVALVAFVVGVRTAFPGRSVRGHPRGIAEHAPMLEAESHQVELQCPGPLDAVPKSGGPVGMSPVVESVPDPAPMAAMARAWKPDSCVVGTSRFEPPPAPEPALTAAASDGVSAMATAPEVVSCAPRVESVPNPEPPATSDVPASSGSYWDRVGPRRVPGSRRDPEKEPHDRSRVSRF